VKILVDFIFKLISHFFNLCFDLYLSIDSRNGLHVIHICTEMAPLVSVGPLASYITGLSCALQEEGYMVEVILPKYESNPSEKYTL